MVEMQTIHCSLAGQCGGCSQIGVSYADQLAAKQSFAESLFSQLQGKMQEQLLGDEVRGEDAPVLLIHPILGMENPVRYRNKIVSPFAPARAQGRKPSLRSMARTGRAGKMALRKSDIACGLYAAGTHKVIECNDCPIEMPVGRRVVAAVREIMARYGVMPYNEDTGAGFMRHVVVRVGATSSEVLVTLVTNGSEFTGAKNFCRELVKRVPEITSIVQNINTRKTNVIFGQDERTLYGPGFILDTLCGLSFRISSHSFYQVNAAQTEVLYRTAIDYALTTEEFGSSSAFDRVPIVEESVNASSLGKPTTIVDAYCGTGTIGLVAAAAVPGAQVIGVDSVDAAVVDARQNAVHNGIENARFICEDAGFFMREYAKAGNAVDVVFMDPPRAGASEEFLHAVAQLAPKRVVYISCNPETQVRDCRVLMEAGYMLAAVQPVDMFPHTNHIECVALLSR